MGMVPLSTSNEHNTDMANLNTRTPEHLHHKNLKTKTTATLNTKTKSLPMNEVGN